MKVYVLSEILTDCWDTKGVFTTLELAQAQVPKAEWAQDVEGWPVGVPCTPPQWTGVVAPSFTGFDSAEYDITEWELQGEVFLAIGRGPDAGATEPR